LNFNNDDAYLMFIYNLEQKDQGFLDTFQQFFAAGRVGLEAA